MPKPKAKPVQMPRLEADATHLQGPLGQVQNGGPPAPNPNQLGSCPRLLALRAEAASAKGPRPATPPTACGYDRECPHTRDERPGAPVPHAAAAEAPERTSGSSQHSQGRYRASAQRRDSGQPAAEQREAAGRRRHGRESPASGRRLCPHSCRPGSAPSWPHAGRSPTSSRSPGRHSRAGPGAALRQGAGLRERREAWPGADLQTRRELGPEAPRDR